MNYEKLTPDRFETNLQEGKYASAGGARRAVGKSSWSEKEKEQAKAAIEKHFGADAAPAKKTGKTKKAGKKAAKAATAKADGAPKRGPGRPKGSKNKATVTAATKAAKTGPAPAPAAKGPGRGRPAAPRTSLTNLDSPSQAILMGGEVIKFVEAVRGQVEGIRKVTPQSDITSIEKELSELVRRATSIVHTSLMALPAAAVSKPVVQASATPTVKAAPVNGTTHEVAKAEPKQSIVDLPEPAI